MEGETMHFAIVDDEKYFADELYSVIKKYMSEINEDFAADFYSDGLTFINSRNKDYDIVFLDIKMPIMNGMETAEKFRKINKTAILIFVTNFEQFALKGYKVDAMDYIIKPIDYAQFSSVLKKALGKAKKRKESQLILNTSQGIIRIPLMDIIYLESIKHHIIFHTLQGDFDCWSTLKKYEGMLPKDQFVRANNGYLINLQFVSEIKLDSVIVNKKELFFSRGRKKGFIEAITKYTNK